MSQNLNMQDIEETIQSKIYRQDYGKKQLIENVIVKDLQNLLAEDGDFSELMRLNEGGSLELFPDFKLAQINRTKVFPGTVKAWHLHFRQDEIWYVMPGSHMLVGLWDIRKNSSTKDSTMKIPMGGGRSQLLYIPRGVAHGYANHSDLPGNVLYFVSNKFDASNPDEMRVPWNSLGDDFWSAARD